MLQDEHNVKAQATYESLGMTSHYKVYEVREVWQLEPGCCGDLGNNAVPFDCQLQQAARLASTCLLA